MELTVNYLSSRLSVEQRAHTKAIDALSEALNSEDQTAQTYQVTQIHRYLASVELFTWCLIVVKQAIELNKEDEIPERVRNALLQDSVRSFRSKTTKAYRTSKADVMEEILKAC